MPLATKQDIIRLGYLCLRNGDKVMQGSIVPAIEDLIKDLSPDQRFCERRRIKKEVRRFLTWKSWIYSCTQHKKAARAKKLAQKKRYRQAYNWSSKRILGKERKTWAELAKNYQVNGPTYVRFINQVADIMQGRLGARKRWFYNYFHPSQFKINDPHAPRTASQIAGFLRRFTFMDRDDWKQLCVIALWEEFSDLSHLPHPFHAWRAIRKTMKKWFYHAYRETFRLLILDQYQNIDLSSNNYSVEQLVIPTHDIDQHLSMYNRYILMLTCYGYSRSVQQELLYKRDVLPLGIQYATISEKLKKIGYPIPSLKEQETNG